MTRGRASRRWLALAAPALLLAASLLVAYAPEAGAKEVDEDRSSLSVVDTFGVDLISQTAATASSPAVIRLRIAAELSTADLRARLYEPVTTRAEFLAAKNGPPTPLITEWIVEDARIVSADEQGVVLSVPIQPPGADLESSAFDDPRPFPLHLELVDAAGAPVRGLATFLTPGASAGVADSGRLLTVAVVLDLRLPPSHLVDGGASVDAVSLNRLLGLAEVLTEHRTVPLSVVISPETLDALALIGDDASVEMLRTALRDRQLLTSTWTSLNLFDWTWAVRADVILDGLRRSKEALRWTGLEASTVMHIEYPLTVRAIRAVTEPTTGVNAFVADTVPNDDGPFPPVTLMADTSGGSHLLAQVDPILAEMVQHRDTELGIRWAHAELLRIAAAGTPSAVLLPVSAHGAQRPDWEDFSTGTFPAAVIEPSELGVLLDIIASDPALRPATVDDVLAQEPPVGAVIVAPTGERLSDPRDFGLYLDRRTQVEQRLEAYESFLGDDPFLVAPLRTLLAVSASRLLTTGERTEFLDAVDQQVAQGTTGVEFLPRGPITVTGRRADLPVTLVNSRPAEVTVALELTSDTISFTRGEISVHTLEPGRNDLLVPIEAAASGRASVLVTVTTPDEAGAITLATGTFTVRFADAEGIGLMILVVAAAALAAWWLQTLRKRSRDNDSDGATVAAPGPVSGSVETSSDTGTPPNRRSQEDMT